MKYDYYISVNLRLENYGSADLSENDLEVDVWKRLEQLVDARREGKEVKLNLDIFSVDES